MDDPPSQGEPPLARGATSGWPVVVARPAAKQEGGQLRSYVDRIGMADDNPVPPPALDVQYDRRLACSDDGKLAPAVAPVAPDGEGSWPREPRKPPYRQAGHGRLFDVHHAEAVDGHSQLAPPSSQALQGFEAHHHIPVLNG